MLRKAVILFVLLSKFSVILSQKISITDMISMCSKKSWEDVNQIVINRNWTFYESVGGESNRYSTIVWSYEKEYYGDKAVGWLHLFTYNGTPAKLEYSVFNKNAYAVIQNTISINGFELIDNKIRDDELVAKYKNRDFILEITTTKRKNETDELGDDGVVAYVVSLIAKSGAYDLENGRKQYYYPNDVLQIECTLTNGKLNGVYKGYNEEGLLVLVCNFNNGLKSGEYYSIHYNELGKIDYKIVCYYKNDQKIGLYNEYLYDIAGAEYLTKSENYVNGVLNGPFQLLTNDSLIVGNYSNGLIDGEYRIYYCPNYYGSDLTKYNLISEGTFVNGYEQGRWKNYHKSGAIFTVGDYVFGKKSGTWSIYLPTEYDETGAKTPFSNELFASVDYLNGKLNGKKVIYYYIAEEKYACSQIDSLGNSIDSCLRMKPNKYRETSYYKENKLNGPYEKLDSLNVIIEKGFFIDDKKSGEWLIRNSHFLNNETIFVYEKGSYLNDVRNGTWNVTTVGGRNLMTVGYLNGDFHGDYIVWNNDGLPLLKKVFTLGKLIQLIRFDETGKEKVMSYEIYNENYFSFKCTHTFYTSDLSISQDYTIFKSGDIYHDDFEEYFKRSADTLSGGAFGYREGNYKVLDANNEILVSGSYFKNTKVGDWKVYLRESNVLINSYYRNGNPIDEKYLLLTGGLYTGVLSYVDMNNKVKENRKIVNGIRSGKTVYIDIESNKVIKVERYKYGIKKS